MSLLVDEANVVCDPQALRISHALKHRRNEIVKCVNLVELEDYLTDKGFLEDGESDYVINLPQEEGVELVLDRVKKCGNDGFKDFLWCLERDKDWQIGHDYVAALLRGDQFTDETQKEIEESLRLQERYHNQLEVIKIIKDSINTNDLIPSLRKHKLLTDEETDELRLPYCTRQENVMKLLRIISTKGPKASLIFTQVLLETVSENPAHRDILEWVYQLNCDDIMKQFMDDTERDSALCCRSDRGQLGKRKRAIVRKQYATKVTMCTPRQVRAHGIILCDKYFDKINEIRRLHYLALWKEAEKVVEECRSLTLTTEAKKLGLPADDELSPTAHIEIYVAVALRNCSGYVTRKKNDKVKEVVAEAKELCQQIDNDNGRVLESKCEWMLAKMYRYSKDIDKAMEHIENAQLIHLRYNIAPGEDTTLCNYCKGCILASQLAKMKEWSTKSKMFQEAKLCLHKASDHAAIRDYAIYQSHHMIRLAQLCLHSSQFVAGDCRDEGQISEAEAALNSHYIDKNVLAPRTKCLFYVTRSDLYRNKKQLELAEREAQRAWDIADENKFGTEIKSAEGRLEILRQLKGRTHTIFST